MTTATFQAQSPEWSENKHNGPVTVVRPLTTDEHEPDLVGQMYECVDRHGTTFHAFEDELRPAPVRPS